MEDVSEIVLNEICSAAMMNELPQRIGDLGSISLPCQFGNLTTSYPLANFGASVNHMAYSFFKKLNLAEP